MTSKEDPNDFSGQYNTKLTLAQEAAYLKWATANNRLKDSYDYDMRGAWLAGVTQDGRGHFPDTFKKPNHPTFSTESKYSTPVMPGGQWGKDYKSFMPSNTNLIYENPQALSKYLKRVEPKVVLTLPVVPKEADLSPTN